MRHLSQELTQRMQEAGKDTDWTEKLGTAATWEECVRLLNEKGIDVPAELKEVFEASLANRTGKLTNDALENVSGGWTNFLPCYQKYDYFTCQMIRCPHLKRDEYLPDDKHYTYSCNLCNWREEFPY